MSEKVRIYKRPLEWWREAGEVPEAGRLEEAYDASRVKIGSDGRNGPDIKKMYVKPGDRNFDALDGKGASYPKKGSSDSKSKGSDLGKAEAGVSESARRPVSKKVVAEAAFDDQPMDDDLEGGMGMDDQMDGGMNPESDVPPDMGGEGDEFGPEGGMEPDGDEVADDVTVEIGGQKYKLVPVEPEGEMGGEEGFEGGPDLGGEDFGPEAGDENAVGAEEDDLTKPQFEAAVRKALIVKNKAEKALQELFTGAYVTNKQGDDVGLDFSMVGGDDEFSVKAPAASGKQYTPSFSVTDGDGMKDQKKESVAKKPVAKKPVAVDRKAAFAKWISEQQAKLAEDGQEDPGKTSEEFNKQDTFGKATPRSPLNPEEYPQIPEIVGSDEDTLSQYKKTQEARKQRRQESEQPVKFPSKSVKDDLESTLEEAFDFRALMAGKYSKKISG
jgi:hypothetical protein